MSGESTGVPIIDAWVQPWLPETVAKMPARNFTLADRMEHRARMWVGMSLQTLIEEMERASSLRD